MTDIAITRFDATQCPAAVSAERPADFLPGDSAFHEAGEIALSLDSQTPFTPDPDGRLIAHLETSEGTRTIVIPASLADPMRGWLKHGTVAVRAETFVAVRIDDDLGLTLTEIQIVLGRARAPS